MSEARLDDAFLRRLAGLELVVRRSLATGLVGRRSGDHAGRGLEFVDHRGYAPGDDVRHLDWAAYARLGRPIVRVFRPDAELALHVLVDTSASMAFGRPSKLGFARALAAALAHLALVALDRVAVHLVSDHVVASLALGRGVAHRQRLLELLGDARAAGPTSLDSAAAAFVARQRGRGALVVLLSDFHDAQGVTPAIDRLRRHGFEPAVIEVVGDEETADRLPDGPLVLADAETGEELPVVLDGAGRQAYAARLRARREALVRHCRRRGIAHASASTRGPLEPAILRALRASGLVR